MLWSPASMKQVKFQSNNPSDKTVTQESPTQTIVGFYIVQVLILLPNTQKVQWILIKMQLCYNSCLSDNYYYEANLLIYHYSS